MTVAEFVERERTRLRRVHLVTAAALVVAATALVVVVGVLVLGGSRWLTLPRAMPFVVWLLLVVVNAVVARWAWQRLVRGAARDRVAAEIEREQALRAGALRGAIETAQSGALGRHAAAGMANRLRGVGPRLAPTMQTAARRRATKTLAAAIVAGILLGVVAPIYGDGLLAILRPVRAWRGTLLPPIQFADLPSAVVRGESLRLRIRAPRRQSVVLHGRATGEGWRASSLRVDAKTGEAIANLGIVQGDLTIVATDGRSATDTATIQVVDRPFVGAVSMRALYPAYLGREAEGLPAGEPARVPQGTSIFVSGRASTILTDVRLVGAAGDVQMRTNGRTFDGRFEARSSGTWTWRARGVGGPIADVPLPVELQVVPDSAPRVQLVSPTGDTAVAAADRVVLRVSAVDDHELAQIALHARRRAAGGGERPGPPAVQRVPAPRAPLWDGSVIVDLASWGLEPGDALALRVVATDNSPWAQTGSSRELVLKVPTLEERRSLAREAGDSAARNARSAADAQRSLARRTEEAARQRGQSRASNDNANAAPRAGETPPMSYEQSEQARSIAKDQQAVAERMEQLRKSAAALEEQLKQAGALDSSLARQLRDVQQMLREALTPELMEQMRKLEEAAQRLSGNEARDAMRDLAAMQQRLREQLEKSAEMLKRAAYEGAMQTLRDEAKDLAKKERDFADSAAKGKDAQAQRDEARKLSERSERFADDVEKLQERLAKDRADAAAKNTDAARRHAESGEERMREAAKAAQRDAERAEANKQDAAKQDGAKAEGAKPEGAKQARQREQASERPGERGQQGSGSQSQQRQAAAEQGAREAAGQMENAAQAMQEARDAQVQEWKKELTSELDQSVQELLQMARQESALEQQARAGRTNAEQMRGRQSSVQQGLDQAGKRLQEAGKKSSLLSGRSQRAMAEAKQKVGEATKQLSGREGEGRSPGSQAASALGEAADALNRAAASLARDREKANGASSASGFAEMLQQLQEMAKRQGAINSQAQGLMSMPGGQGSPGAQATAQALARQQRSVAQQLDEMGDQPGANRASELAREARRLAEALEGGRLDAATIARQEQLFRRLLDAGRSLEKDEREDSERREAKAAVGAEAVTPENTNATGRAATRFREPSWDDLRGLSADERRAILEYFKRINAERP
jgi:hypothetical protein